MVIYVPYFDYSWHIMAMDTTEPTFKLLENGKVIHYRYRLFSAGYVFSSSKAAIDWCNKGSSWYDDQIDIRKVVNDK